MNSHKHYTKSNQLKRTLILGHQQSDYQILQVYNRQPSPYFHDKLAPVMPTETTVYKTYH